MLAIRDSPNLAEAAPRSGGQFFAIRTELAVGDRPGIADLTAFDGGCLQEAKFAKFKFSITDVELSRQTSQCYEVLKSFNE